MLKLLGIPSSKPVGENRCIKKFNCFSDYEFSAGIPVIGYAPIPSRLLSHLLTCSNYA